MRKQRAGFAKLGVSQPITGGIRGGAQCQARSQQRARGERKTLDRRAGGGQRQAFGQGPGFHRAGAARHNPVILQRAHAHQPAGLD
ncbi:MAG TPA: hypothetical protein VIR57_02815, partial [Chloroflexota bacterium]